MEESGGTGLLWAGMGIIMGLALFLPQAAQVVFQDIPTLMLRMEDVGGNVIVAATGETAEAVSEEVISMPREEREVMEFDSTDLLAVAATAPLAQNTRSVSDATAAALDRAERGSSAGVSMNLEPALNAWNTFVPISIFVSLLFLVGIVYSAIRLSQIRANEKFVIVTEEHPVAHGNTSKIQLRWEKIMGHVNSENENDWRLAILEADIMLKELLDVQGYRGDTMGDQMKQVERADWNTIDLAWEAHKVRNKVAHEGSDLMLNQRETRRVITLYEKVFQEFRFI